ncbi:TIGR04255 family protein [Calothrix sp. NIES-2098]|uniref:TIGR04255 family protein n=1 Tax=Calothrix sp. NIES-2098 TaxID=1954171 RepID=UPI000B60582E|nr:hypothetical protein NIES2098_35780 [Calothrix sp. NIES-2098]
MSKTDELLRLENAPLVYVLAQVVFNPILLMEDFIPTIQEKLRRKGYIKYKYAPTQEIVLGKDVQVSVLNRWIFSNKNEQESVVISQNFIVLETSNYDVFDTFIKTFQDIIIIFEDITKPEFIERIGLRYVDLIRKKKEETFSDYLQPGLLGVSAEQFGSSNSVSRLEQIAKTPVGEIAIRLSLSNNGSYLPPDLLNSSVIHSINIELGETVAILDIDHFSIQPRDFIIDRLMESMQELHQYIKKAFIASVTNYALKIWNVEEIAT